LLIVRVGDDALDHDRLREPGGAFDPPQVHDPHPALRQTPHDAVTPEHLLTDSPGFLGDAHGP